MAFGAEASQLMAVIETAMLGGMPYTALRDAIFACRSPKPSRRFSTNRLFPDSHA